MEKKKSVPTSGLTCQPSPQDRKKAKKKEPQGHPLSFGAGADRVFLVFGGQKELMEEWEMALERGEQGRGGRNGSVLLGKVKLMGL